MFGNHLKSVVAIIRLLADGNVVCVQEERFHNLVADGLESGFTVVQSGAAAAPIDSIFVCRASEICDALI